MPRQMSQQTRDRVETCSSCCTVCIETAARCPEIGGNHSDFHPQVCGLCAASCEQIDPNDEQMRACAEMCRRCARSCREMAA